MRPFIALSVLVCAGSASSAPALVLNVDFGSNNYWSAYYGWNNILANASGGSSLNRLVEESGPLTTISLTMTDPFNPLPSEDGTTAPTGAVTTTFPPNSTRDSLFGSVAAFGGIAEPTAGYTLGGLDPSGATRYTFSFFASVMGETDNRETAYTLLGGNSLTALLNPSNNTGEMATITGMIPDSSGNIVLAVGPGANNNSPSGFYHLGAMKIVSVVPEPTGLSTLVLTSAMLRHRRRRV